jgi:hypothetical protein
MNVLCEEMITASAKQPDNQNQRYALFVVILNIFLLTIAYFPPI